MSLDASLFPDGTYAVVGPNDLQARTAAGFRLVKVLTGAHGTQFLLVEHRDATHEGLREQLQAREREIAKASRERYDLQAELRALKGDVKKARNDSAAFEAAIADLDAAAREREQAIDDYAKRCGAMEDAMGRVRRHIGEKTWAEALAK